MSLSSDRSPSIIVIYHNHRCFRIQIEVPGAFEPAEFHYYFSLSPAEARFVWPVSSRSAGEIRRSLNLCRPALWLA